MNECHNVFRSPYRQHEEEMSRMRSVAPQGSPRKEPRSPPLGRLGSPGGLYPFASPLHHRINDRQPSENHGVQVLPSSSSFALRTSHGLLRPFLSQIAYVSCYLWKRVVSLFLSVHLHLPRRTAVVPPHRTTWFRLPGLLSLPGDTKCRLAHRNRHWSLFPLRPCRQL
jgi:hypothetical protein